MKIEFASHEVELIPEGALFIEALSLLCIADLHFEKGSFFSLFSTFLPPYDSFETLTRLEKLIQIYQPRIVIAAGDSFHDKAALARLSTVDRSRLDGLVAKRDAWHWIAGNHDPSLSPLMDGVKSFECSYGGISFRHQIGSDESFEVSGHFHPKKRVTIRRQKIGGRCFVRGGKKLIMPSFGEYTGGLDIDGEAFQKSVPLSEREVFLIHGDRIFNV